LFKDLKKINGKKAHDLKKHPLEKQSIALRRQNGLCLKTYKPDSECQKSREKNQQYCPRFTDCLLQPPKGQLLAEYSQSPMKSCQKTKNGEKMAERTSCYFPAEWFCVFFSGFAFIFPPRRAGK
jgi:hypothetical protein